MPRLSIIVPHILDEAALETTLLSILENRPAGCEILVAHGGNYRDPYHLDRDEIRLIEAPPQGDVVKLLNAAVNEACGAILHTVLPGCLVEANWTAPAVAWFQDTEIGSVSPTVTTCDGKSLRFSGLDSNCLPRRSWCQRARRGDSMVATLCGGFYRRQTVRALNGWLASCQREGAEAEMAMAFQVLSFRGIAEPESRLQAPRKILEGQMGGYPLGNQAGKLAMAYSQIAPSTHNASSLAARIGYLAGGLISPTSVAERLGWVLGATDRSLVAEIQRRIEQAESALARHQPNATQDYRVSTRRAA